MAAGLFPPRETKELTGPPDGREPDPSCRRAGAARGSRPGAEARIALVCAPPLFSPDKFLGEKLGSFIRRSLAVSAAFQRTWFQGGK